MSRRLIAIYRGWDLYERRHDGPRIIDFDLASGGIPTQFNNRSAVLEALLDIHENLHGATGVIPFLRSRVEGSIAYLRALMGVRTSFQDYIRETLGTAVVLVEAEEIESAQKVVQAQLEPFNIEYSREERVRFERKFLVDEKLAIMNGIVEQQEIWLARLRSFRIPVPATIQLNIRFESIDELWSNWISGSSRDGFDLSINLHPQRKYYLGSLLALCLHEICGHAAQMAIWAEQIKAGSLDEACGVTTVHSPETFAAEGLGQTVHLLFATRFPLPAELWLRKAQQYHELLVMQNAHLMLYAGRTVEESVQYAYDLLPFSRRADLMSDLQRRVSDPLSRTYQLAYSTAERAIRGLLQRMNAVDVCKFFAGLYEKPMTPGEVLSLGTHL